MSKTAPAYVRVYQSVVDDEKFVGIYDDDHHFATWVRLLMAADALWPASCPVPSGTRRASLKALQDAGIIDVYGTRFRVRGLDGERERRQTKARASAEHRWSDRNATALRTQSDRNARTRGRASVSDSEEPVTTYLSGGGPGEGDDPEWPVLSWMASAGASLAPNGNGLHVRLVKLVERQGPERVLAAMRELQADGARSDRQFIFGAEERLEPVQRGKSTKPAGHHAQDLEAAVHAFDR